MSRDSVDPEEVTVTFYVTADGVTVTATNVSETFEEIGPAKMSAVLGLEVRFCVVVIYLMIKVMINA